MSIQFTQTKNIISDVVNHVVDCMQIDEIGVWGEIQDELNGLYQATHQGRIVKISEVVDYKLLYMRIDEAFQFELIWQTVELYRKDHNFIIYLSDDNLIDKIIKKGITVYPLKGFSSLYGGVILVGEVFDDPKDEKVPDEFKVLAIIHFYNEADVLEATINYLIGQGVDIYLIDNWSDDGSYEIAQILKQKNEGRIILERFPIEGKTQYYEWYHQLERTEQIAHEAQYDWYIHYDADEWRVSPWADCTLRTMLYHVDKLGYNVIENTVINHKLTSSDEFIYMKDVLFEFGHKIDYFRQTKTWKRTEWIDLKSTGGHIAQVKNPRLYPLKILNRHYPFRSIEQAKRKVFQDRKPRFEKEKREHGWHGHYDHFLTETDLISKVTGLLAWNSTTQNKLFIPLFTGCGIWRDDINSNNSMYHVDYIGKRVILYGAGNIGRRVYTDIVKIAKTVLWVDSHSEVYGMIYGVKIQPPEAIDFNSADVVIIAVKNHTAQEEIKKILYNKGIQDRIIQCI